MPVTMVDGSVLVLAQVKSFNRVVRGRQEHVHGFERRDRPRPLGEAISNQHQGVPENLIKALPPRGWIPEAKWLEGQQIWKQHGEEAWRQHWRDVFGAADRMMRINGAGFVRMPGGEWWKADARSAVHGLKGNQVLERMPYPPDAEHAVTPDQLADMIRPAAIAEWKGIEQAARQHEAERLVVRKPMKGPWIEKPLPGMPKPNPTLEQAVRQTLDRLSKDQASGIKAEKKPHAKRGLVQDGGDGANYFGNSGQTSIITFNDHHKWVRKDIHSSSEAETEVLGSLVANALGTGGPLVVHDPDDPDVIWEPFLIGAQTAIEWLGGTDEDETPLGDNDPEEMYDSDRGLAIGVMDTITGNEDRHFGNWMVQKGEPVPIDEGRMWYGSPDPDSGSGDFGEYLVSNEADTLGRISAAQWAEWRASLGRLREEFADAGRDYDYQSMMNAFDQLEQASNGYRDQGSA